MKYKSSFEEIWEARQQIYNDCNNNPKDLIEYYISLQNEKKSYNDNDKIQSIKKSKSRIRKSFL